MKKNYGFLICVLLLLTSCNIVIKEAGNWIEKSNSNSPEDITGNYFALENGLVKTYLPHGFKQCTIEQYESILDSSLTKNQIKAEISRLEGMRNLKGSFYLFFDSYTRSTYTINNMPYLSFNKNDAKMLLSIIKQNNDRVSLSTDLNFKKLTASYAKTKEFTMFRSIFQINNFKTEMKAFNTSYILSANKKTFMINLTTPFKTNFDGYIEKMKF